MEFTTKLVSYEEVKNGYRPLHDDLGLFAGLTDARKQVFFANPNQTDDTKCLMMWFLEPIIKHIQLLQGLLWMWQNVTGNMGLGQR